MVKAETISCLKEAGILDSSMDMVTHDEENPFLAADELALQDLMKNNNNEWSRQLHAGGVCHEDSIPVCMEFDSDRWDESFLSHLGDDAYDLENS